MGRQGGAVHPWWSAPTRTAASGISGNVSAVGEELAVVRGPAIDAAVRALRPGP